MEGDDSAGRVPHELTTMHNQHKGVPERNGGIRGTERPLTLANIGGRAASGARYVPAWPGEVNQ